jgi:TPR repeat protein
MHAAIALALGMAAAAAQTSLYDQAQAALARHETARAIALFEAAARKGNAAAAYNLGRIYSQGEGAPVNPQAAIHWFRAAAGEGNPGAAYQLGLAFQTGRGVTQSAVEAAHWLRKAADQGYVDAEARLGALYARGEGVPQDRSEAARWYAAAASHGDAGARLDLALIDAEGRPPPATAASAPGQAAFSQSMNRVFGAGRWRETGGYRSQARENQLRAEGALTVRPGQVSRHSLGTPASPGAYDIVVAGLSPSEAAFRIRKSGVAFHRLFPEGAHGTQGAHLHVEPFLAKLRDAIWRRDGQAVARAAPTRMASPANDRAEALSLLRSAATRGDVCAQGALEKGMGDGEAAARNYLSLQTAGRCG